MEEVCVKFNHDNWLFTKINASFKGAQNYYLGHIFNVGNGPNDHVVRATHICRADRGTIYHHDLQYYDGIHPPVKILAIRPSPDKPWCKGLVSILIPKEHFGPLWINVREHEIIQLAQEVL